MNTATDTKTLVTRYIQAVGEKNYDAVAQALASLRRMAPIWNGNTIRNAEACAMPLAKSASK